MEAIPEDLKQLYLDLYLSNTHIKHTLNTLVVDSSLFLQSSTKGCSCKNTKNELLFKGGVDVQRTSSDVFDILFLRQDLAIYS